MSSTAEHRPETSSLVVGPELAACIADYGRPVSDAYGGHVLPCAVGPINGHGTGWRRVLLHAIGAQFEPVDGGYFNALAPDPERLAAVAAKQGLPIRLIHNNLGKRGGIHPETYGSVVAGKAHPVSTSSLTYYEHDIAAHDHMGSIVVCGPELFDLYPDDPSDLIDIADMHDLATGNFGGIGEALMQLLEQGQHGQWEFDRIIDEDLPHRFGESAGQWGHDTEISLKLRQLISAGLDRLGIEHPNVSELSARQCATC